MPEGVAVSSGAGSGSGAGISSGSGAGSGSGEPVVTHGPADHGSQGDRGTHDRGTEGGERHAEGVEDTDLDDFGGESFEGDEFGDDFSDDTGKAEEISAKEAFAKLKEKLKDDPALLKQVKKALGMTNRYAKIPGMETPEAAQAIADRLESLGGLEGIERETGEAATLWNMLAAGDAGILNTLEKDYADGLSKLAPALWDKMREMDKATWNHKSAQTFMATIHQSGVANALETLQSIQAVKDSPEAMQLLGKVINAINGVAAISERAPSKDLSPEAKRLKDKEAELGNRETQIYHQGVSAKLAPVQRSIAKREVTRVLGSRKISGEAMKDLLADTLTVYAELAKKDPTFQKNAKAHLGAQDTENFLKTCKRHLEANMAKAASRAWRKYAGISGISSTEQQRRKEEGQSRRETAGGGAAQGTIKTATPAPKDIDWERMRVATGSKDAADDMFMKKRQYFKKGDSKNTYSF